MLAAISFIPGLILTMLGISFAILLIVTVLVPVLRALGAVIAWVFNGIGMLIMHVATFITGVLGDLIRLVGAIPAIIVLIPLALLNVVLGRWSAAG
ncbi:MAG: hypothetical protein KDA28_10580, partial [Phycisphaerales bacterium]|nr:hypothetical protein [Phycisphaerales bacterium]